LPQTNIQKQGKSLLTIYTIGEEKKVRIYGTQKRHFAAVTTTRVQRKELVYLNLLQWEKNYVLFSNNVLVVLKGLNFTYINLPIDFNVSYKQDHLNSNHLVCPLDKGIY
jgi:hypothetical protein